MNDGDGDADDASKHGDDEADGDDDEHLILDKEQIQPD